MKKRLLSYLLVIAMVLTFLPTVAMATDGALQVSADSLKGDDTVTVTYKIPNSVDIGMLELRIGFDKTKLEATEIVWNTVAGFSAFIGSDHNEANANGYFSGSCNSSNFTDVTVPANQILVTATFEIKDGAEPGSAAFTVDELFITDMNATDKSVAAGTTTTGATVMVVSEISDAQAITIAKPVKNGIPQTTVAENAKYTGAIIWNGNPVKFAADTAYTATVTLTAKTGYKFTDTASATVAGAASVTEKAVAANGSTMTFKANFEETAAKELTGIVVTTKPSDLTYTHGETLNTADMVVTATYDDDSTENVTGSATLAYNEGTSLRRGDTSVTVSYGGKNTTLDGLTVAAKELTITGLVATNRAYNGTTAVALSGGALSGRIDGDDVNVVIPNVGTVEDANVGNGKAVIIVKPALTGADADCYTLADITGVTVDISAASIVPTVTLQGWTYGDDANDPVLSGNTYSGNVTYEYKLASADDSEYSTMVPEAVGEYTVRATIAATANSSGNSCTANFSISKKALSDSMIQAIADQMFTGSAIEPTITVKDGNATLVITDDYTVSYSANTNVGTATVTITGAGNYTGTASKTFVITAKTITEANFTTLGTAAKTYNGEAQTQAITPNGLVLDTDYIVAYSANTNAGTAKYTITGKGNYTGSFEKEFTINPKTIEESDFTTLGEVDKVYTGSAQTQTVESELVSGTDYTVAYENNTYVGTASYTITGKGNYTGTITKNFTISPAEYTVTVADMQDVKVGSGLDKITVTNGVSGVGVNGETLNGTFAWFTNEGCTSPAADSDISNVELDATKTLYWKFSPAANSNYNTTAKTGSVVFTIVEGDPQTLTFDPNAITKTYGDANFTKTASNDRNDGGSIAYTSSNTEVATVNATTGEVTILKKGSATITATAAAVPGVYASGSASYTLTVNAKPVANAMIQAIADQVFTGAAIEPVITVKDGDNTLTLATDYTASYSANANVGTATVTITGAGNYTGTASKTFAITAKTITAADFTTLGEEPKTYNGGAQTQTIVSALVLDTDYTVAYSANTDAGTAKYTITGKGNYTGSFEKEFTINPKTIEDSDFTTLGEDDKVYTGSAQTQTVESELVSGTDYTVAYENNTYVGTASYTITGAGNYTGTITKNFDITAAEYDLTRVPTTLYIGSTYTANTIKNAISNAGTVTIDSIVVYKADGTTPEVDPEEATKIAEFNGETDTVTAKGAGKMEITYSIAANNINEAGADEYNAKTPQTVVVTLQSRPVFPVSPAPAAPSKPPVEEKVENPFVDVTEDDYYCDAVLWAVEKKITMGVGEDKFAPNAGCTRGQMVTFLWRAVGCPETQVTTNKFTDVDESDYYYKAVLWAIEKGITFGISEITFAPDAECTRGQMAAFLYRAVASPAVSGDAGFDDVAADSYYADAVAWAVENKITLGTGDNKYSPNYECSRAQMVTFLYRAYGNEA